jgi:hypothetical protein
VDNCLNVKRNCGGIRRDEIKAAVTFPQIGSAVA